VLRVFRALLYTYTMPNHHYTSTYMLAYHHLKSPRLSESLWELSWESPGHVLDMSSDNPFVLYFAGHRHV
jgi:hypothetical protein